jgi:hypothetical protein
MADAQLTGLVIAIHRPGPRAEAPFPEFFCLIGKEEEVSDREQAMHRHRRVGVHAATSVASARLFRVVGK